MKGFTTMPRFNFEVLETPVYTPVPAGHYPAIAKSIIPDKSKSGNPMIVWEFVLSDDDKYVGRILKKWTVIPTKPNDELFGEERKKAMRSYDFQMASIKSMLEGFDIPCEVDDDGSVTYEFEYADLAGQEVLLDVGIGIDNRTGKENNNINGTIKLVIEEEE